MIPELAVLRSGGGRTHTEQLLKRFAAFSFKDLRNLRRFEKI